MTITVTFDIDESDLDALLTTHNDINIVVQDHMRQTAKLIKQRIVDAQLNPLNADQKLVLLGTNLKSLKVK